MFRETDRQIYQSPDGRSGDPLRIERALRLAAGGLDRFNGWLEDIAAWDRLKGRQNAEGEELAKADVAAALAEEGLVGAARSAFAYTKGDLDAVVLETLYHFLAWLEGKGTPAANGPTSRPATGPSAPSPSYAFGMFPPRTADGRPTNSTSGSS